MGKTLTEIAQELKDSHKKVQLIYAFNGVGKTRLSRKFRLLVDPKETDDNADESDNSKVKIIYYNAFTEDLFYWDNDLNSDTERKLKIQPNSFTNWVLAEQGQEPNIITHFQNYTNKNLSPRFNQQYIYTDTDGNSVTVPSYSEVTFLIARGDDESTSNIKISKGEESNFIWCVFYSLMEQIINELNITEPENRSTADYNDLQYVFIDDPVSSLDENHLIELAVNISQLIKSSVSSSLKFIISTHSPLFYNVLYSELGVKSGFVLNPFDNGTFNLEEKRGDSNKCFSYHLHLKKTIEQAIEQRQIQRYHFNLIRNLYEKTAHFLGYSHWSDLLPGDKQLYHKRIINFTSHSTLSNETVSEPTEPEKQTINLLLNHLIDNYSFWQEATTDVRS